MWLTRLCGNPQTEQLLNTAMAEVANRYLSGVSFDPGLQISLRQWIELLQKSDPITFFMQDNNPLRQLTDLLFSYYRYWVQQETKTSEQALGRLNECLQHWPVNAQESWMRLHEGIMSDQQKAHLLEKRLCDAELHQLKVSSAEDQVTELLNQALANQWLPTDLHEQLHYLKNELQYTLLVAGAHTQSWKTWSRIIPVWGKQFDPEIDQQQQYREIPPLLNELERCTKFDASHPENYLRFIDTLSQCLSSRIQNIPLSISRFEGLHNRQNDEPEADVAPQVMQQAKLLPLGCWLLIEQPAGNLLRIKLSLKSDDNLQLLFVDLQGKKALQTNAKTIAFLLASGKAKNLPALALEPFLQQIIETAYARQQQLEHQQKQAEFKAMLARIEQAKAEETRQQQRLANEKAAREEAIRKEHQLRRDAAQKAMNEARILAQEKARKQQEEAFLALQKAEAEAQAQAAEYARRLQEAQLQLTGLSVGARVSLRVNQEEQIAKLAVIIAGGSKYIFTDNLGRKLIELQRDTLMEMLIAGELNLVSAGNSFDNQLEKVIRGLRKDL